MTTPSCWPAPAKLNLMLRVVGRRPDGYHLLQTVFQFIDLGDLLRLVPRDDGEVCRLDPLPGVPPEADLTVRAARLLQAACGTGHGIDIGLVKRIPLGGGLGGGSSDAATTLVALNRIWGCGLATSDLMALGLDLGADVPIFIHGRAAWAEGVGEVLEDVDLPEPVYAVFAPGCRVGTGEIFQDPELTRNSPRITIRDFAAGQGGNDCLPVVRRRHPEVAQLFDWLNERQQARLTGTGACVFAACADRDQAEALVAARPAGVQGFVAHGLNRSPLLDGPVPC